MRLESNSILYWKLRCDILSLLYSNGHASLVLTILELLDGLDLIRAQLVCKTWKEFVFQLWQHHEHKRLRFAWTKAVPTTTEIECHKRRSVCTVSAVAVDEEDIALALGGSGDLEVWSRNGPRRRWLSANAHPDGVYGVAMSSGLVVSGGDDGSVQLRRRRSGDLMQTLLHHDYIVWNVGIYDDVLFTASYDCSISYFDISDFNEPVMIKTIRGPISWADAAALNAMATLMATVDEQTFVISIWRLELEDAMNATPSHVLKGHEGEVHCVRFAGNLIASGGEDKVVLLWDLSAGGGNCIRKFRGMRGKIWTLDLDRKRLAAGGRFGEVRVWYLEDEDGDGRVLQGHHNPTTAVGQIHLDGRTMLITTDGLGMVKIADFWRFDA